MRLLVGNAGTKVFFKKNSLEDKISGVKTVMKFFGCNYKYKTH